MPISRKNDTNSSCDEKSDIQAIQNIALDLSPSCGTYPYWSRNYEYKRHTTLSLLAIIDLLSGKIYGEIHNRHRRKEFIGDLKAIINYIHPNLKSK